MTDNDPRVHPHLSEAIPVIPTAPIYDVGALRIWLHAWLTDQGLLTSGETWRRIDGWRMPEFAALFYPDCQTLEDTQLCCAWVTWLHHFDDQFDKPEWLRCVDHAQTVVDTYLEFTWAARNSVIRGSDDPVLASFGDLVTRIVTPMSTSWRNRFFDQVDIWLRSYVAETTHRSRGIILSPRLLVRHKRMCMAVPPCCEVLERVSTGELPADLRELLAPAVDLVCDITGAVNDIVSFEREQFSDSKHNLMLSVMDHWRTDQVTAVNQVRRMIDAWVDDFRQIMNTYPRNPIFHPHNDAVDRWMAGCQAMVRGYYDWTLRTSRYREQVSTARPGW
jgi:hypothetical protein